MGEDGLRGWPSQRFLFTILQTLCPLFAIQNGRSNDAINIAGDDFNFGPRGNMQATPVRTFGII